MDLIRWNPSADLLNIHSELDQVFDRMLQGWGWTPAPNEGQSLALLPVDIHRQDGNLAIEASVPGFKPEEVNLTVEGNILTIEARHEETIETKEKSFIRRERRSGGYFRQVALPEQVEGEKAKASFADGVLTVTVPLVAKPEPKRIPINK